MSSAIMEFVLSDGSIGLIDQADWGEVRAHSWDPQRGRGTSYAIRTERAEGWKHTVRLHRELMRAPSGDQVDHINGNGLDNRRDNLRFASAKQNKHNSTVRADCVSGLKGVRKYRKGSRWGARITIPGRGLTCLGGFATADAAARAYDTAARKHFGPFARCNFPEEA